MKEQIHYTHYTALSAKIQVSIMEFHATFFRIHFNVSLYFQKLFFMQASCISAADSKNLHRKPTYPSYW